MQVQQKGITTAKTAKDYLSKNEIPQLFECLMTGLMYHRPLDYINYLQDCLEKIRKQGVQAVHWDMFLESKKTPLPPITSAPKENFRPEPLPEIGSLQLKISAHASIIIIQGGPGIRKSQLSDKLNSNFAELYHLKLGLKIRERALIECNEMNSKWKNVADLINEGNLAPEDFVLEILIKELNNHSDEELFLIDGYPRTVAERQDFERLIGFNRVKFMVLVDCEEEVCQRNLQSTSPKEGWKDNSHSAISKRINNYKSNTLAVCKYFDDNGKLKVIDGDKDSESVFCEVLHLFNKEIKGIISPRHDTSLMQSPRPQEPAELQENEDIMELTDIPLEISRPSDLPQCTIILLLGGPGSGKTEISSYLCKKYSNWVHIDLNEELRMKIMNSDRPDTNIAQKSPECENEINIVENLVVNIHAVYEMLKSFDYGVQVILIEGIPKSKEELIKLNTEIGKTDYVILLDSDEESMKSRLAGRFSRYGFLEDDDKNADMRLRYFKKNGLPICRYYDERCHLNIINSDRDTLYIIEDIEKIIPHLINNRNNSALVEDENTENDTIFNEEENNNQDGDNDEAENIHQENEKDIEKADVAAITIQAAIRGHLIRKRLKESRKMEAEENVIEPVVAKYEGDRGVRTNSQMILQDSNIILLLGGPGSGKQLLADHIVIKYALSLLHVDQLIHNEINSDSEYSQSLNQCVESNYEDITPILSFLRKKLVQALEVSPNVIIAGFPKTIEQYQLFIDEVALVSSIIYIDVDLETMQQRLEAEEDSDSTTNISDQITDFAENGSVFVEELKSLDIFSQINGNGLMDEVLAEASEVLDKLSFLQPDE